MDQTLEMNFKTMAGRKFKISVNHMKEGLLPADIKKAMETITSKNIFSVDGGLQEIVGANIIGTQTNAVTF